MEASQVWGGDWLVCKMCLGSSLECVGDIWLDGVLGCGMGGALCRCVDRAGPDRVLEVACGPGRCGQTRI